MRRITVATVVALASCTGNQIDSGGSKAGDTGQDSSDTDSGETEETGDTCPPIDSEPWGDPCAAEGCKLTGSEASSYRTAPPTFDASGDADGDGWGDVLVGLGSYGADNEGRTYVLPGGALWAGRLEDAGSGTVTGDTTSAGVGDYNVRTGDFDDDGSDDIAVVEWAGDRVLVFPGPICGDLLPSDAIASLTSDQAGGGNSIIGRFLDVGDFDGDAYTDLLVGDGATTAVWMVPGPFVGALDLDTVATASIAHDFSTGDVYYDDDESAAVIGDADGDGLDDILVVSDTDISAIRMYVGGVLGEREVSDADAVWQKESTGYYEYTLYFGRRSADLDGDGYLDLALHVRSPGGSMIDIERGPFHGSYTVPGSDGVTSVGDQTLEGTAILDDLDGDGKPELAIGAADPVDGKDGGPGAVYLLPADIRGTSAITDVAAEVLRGDGVDGIGGSLAAAPDLDGDGLPELLVAAPGDDDGGEDAGAVWILPGATLLDKL